MEDAIVFAVEMNQRAWNQLVAGLKDVTPEEAEWRPVPESNNINLIIRHLVIEAQWQNDFDSNCKKLEQSCTGFIDALRRTTFPGLVEKGQTAYQEHQAAGVSPAPHVLGFHHAMHLTGHGAQISMLRNLYRRTRGEPGLMFPANPTFPK